MNLSRRLIATAALIAVTLSLLALPAAAHTGFESSDPVDGSVVAGELDTIVLSFSGHAEPAGDGFVILDPTGVERAPDTVTSGPAQKVWTLGFDPPLGQGPIGLRWTVQAPDAHPIEGSFSFTVNAPAPGDQPTDGPNPGVSPQASTPDDEIAALGSNALETADREQVPDSTGTAAAEYEYKSPDGQDLDAFLAATETGAANAEGFGAFGRILGFVGTMVGIGGVVFAKVVLHGRRGDTLAVLRLVRYSAVLVFVGTLIDLAAHLAVAGDGWSTLLTLTGGESVALSSYGVAVGLRSAGALLLLVVSTVKTTTFAREVSAPAQARSVVSVGAGAVTGTPIDDGFGPDSDRSDAWPEVGPLTYSAGPDQALPAVSISPAMILGVVALLVSFTFDGHTVTEGNRWITGVVDMVHVVAGAVWAGGVLAFATTLWRRHRLGIRLDGLELAIRFSVVAGAALAAAGVAGTVLAVIILDSVSELWTTPWGLVLIGKFTAVAAAAGLGTFNHFVVIPWMETDPVDDARSLMLRNTATGEAILLCIVLVLTAFLVGAAS